MATQNHSWAPRDVHFRLCVVLNGKQPLLNQISWHYPGYTFLATNRAALKM